MTDNITIIKDISLLYELSLSVGVSLDARENCHHFLRALIRRKGLSFAAVWIHRKNAGAVEYCDLFCIYPHFREDQTAVACSHYILSELSEKPYLTIAHTDPYFADVLHEKKIAEGSYAIFTLGDLGFLKLFASNRPQGFDDIELAQLQPVVDKFKISLDGCFAHARLKEETEQRIGTQKALEHAQIRLTNLIANLQAGILLEDENRRIVLANQFFCDIFRVPVAPELLNGADCSQAAEQSKSMFVEPEQFVESVNRLVKNRQIEINEPMYLADGRMLERDFIPLFSGDKYLGHLWQYRDVTERFNAQRAVRESEEKYRGIMENMELGLLEVDLNQIIIRPYPAFCEMLGYRTEELVGRNTLDFLLPEHYHQFMLDRDVERRNGRSDVYEIQLYKKDGTLMWALVSGAPVRNSKGEITGSIGIHYDLTAQKKLEHELATAKRAADQARLAERQFLANMSHEIRTPMNAVIGMTHLLYETGPNPEQKEYLDSLRFSADSLMGLIDNILDLSKIEAGELELEERAFDLQHLLKSLQRAFQFKVRDKAISVNVEYDYRIKNRVKGDPTRLSQILNNLLGNASKFTEKGTIGIRASLLETQEDRCRIEFQVHDTGIGIPKEKQEDIFGYFKQADVQTTRKFGGSGLGLTIVKQLVEIQQGAIRVESAAGQGANFIFTLPFALSDARIDEPGPDELPELVRDRAALRELHVLSVEDNAMNQKLISRILDSWGCRYQLATNGIEALKLTMQQRFDVILMDMHMPETDGCEATRIIRNSPDNCNVNTPIIALTAAALFEEKKRAIEAGMQEFLTKPFSPKMLEECVFRVLENGILRKEGLILKSTINPEQTVEVNLKYLFELGNGDTIFVRDMMETYIAETPDAFGELDRALAAGDWELLYRVVHKTKSNFGILGMKAQRELAERIETGIKSGPVDHAEISNLLQQLKAGANAAVEVLKNKLHTW